MSVQPFSYCMWQHSRSKASELPGSPDLSLTLREICSAWLQWAWTITRLGSVCCVRHVLE